jgi:DNA-binding NarL/FixJ family response regulator
MINILLVDDDDLVRCGIRMLLDKFCEIKIIGEAANGERAIQLARDLKPDVVVMDLKMPGIGGLEATRKILQIEANIKVIIVTSCTDEPIPSCLMRAGAMGYVTKTTDADELAMAIHKAHSGQPYITPIIAQQMALRRSTNDSAGSMIDKLSQREMQVMWMVIRGSQVNDIAARLNLSPKTINTYRYRMFEKLAIKNNVELTHLALKHGMIDHDMQIENAAAKQEEVE